MFCCLSISCLYQSGNSIISKLRQEDFSECLSATSESIQHISVDYFLSLLNHSIAQFEHTTG